MAAANWNSDIFLEILKRLPVKSIIKCTSVRKEWQTLIASNEFIQAHLAYTLAARQPNFLALHHLRIHGEFFALYCYDDNSQPLRTFFPYSMERYGVTVVRVFGSLHGLLCFAVAEDYCNCFIWNPSINQYLEIPESYQQFKDEFDFAVLGFGFDSSMNDYKLVRIVFSQTHCVQIGIYSLRQRAWRELEPTKVSPYAMEFWQVGLYFENSIHWLAIDKNVKNAILSFNLNNEEFTRMELPTELIDFEANPQNLRISESNGSLTIFHLVGEVADTSCIWCNGHESCNIWVKGEHSWTKTFTITLTDLILLRVIEWRENRLIITVDDPREEKKEHKLASYDFTTGRTEAFGAQEDACVYHGGAFLESLLLHNEAGTVSEVGLGD